VEASRASCASRKEVEALQYQGGVEQCERSEQQGRRRRGRGRTGRLSNKSSPAANEKERGRSREVNTSQQRAREKMKEMVI
jgi:hypothetical protein